MLDNIPVKTPTLEEFAVDKIISFFTREELSGVGRDGYDLFMINKKHTLTPEFIGKTNSIIRKNIVSLDYNLLLFEENMEKIDAVMRPYAKKEPIESKEVLKFLKRLRESLK